jgi:hypothetical protein
MHEGEEKEGDERRGREGGRKEGREGGKEVPVWVSKAVEV